MKTKVYRLISVEEPLGNGRTIDFKLKKVDNKKTYLVEVLSIHIDTLWVEKDSALIAKFFEYRLHKKNEVKMKWLQDYPPFYLLPVLWGGHEDIKVYSDFFKANKLNLKKVIEPVSLLIRFNETGNFESHFKVVGNLFSDWRFTS